MTAGRRLVNLIKLAYSADLPVMLIGGHGIGKSEMLQQAARELNIDCLVRDLSLMEPPDLIGIPHVEGGVTRYASRSKSSAASKRASTVETSSSRSRVRCTSR